MSTNKIEQLEKFSRTMAEVVRLRLDKLLVHMGRGTRSEIRKMVKQQRITVNGQLVKDSGIHVDSEHDVIELDHERIVYREFVYMMLNKPQGVISATEDARDRTVVDLLPKSIRSFQPFPVGRLDKDTEGLLLLTNDGKLSHQLLSPRRHVPKTYFAIVSGRIDENDQKVFAEGVTLDDGYTTMPGELEILPAEQVELYEDKVAEVNEKSVRSAVHVTIYEGKYHQVKRMFAAVGKKVLYLKRISMGDLRLDEQLLPGQFRELTDEELRALTS